jgi:hypothetical protein
MGLGLLVPESAARPGEGSAPKGENPRGKQL